MLPKAGHFFVRTHAVPLAEALVAHATRASAPTEAAPTPPALAAQLAPPAGPVV